MSRGEVTILTYTHPNKINHFQLYIKGKDIPKNIKGIENIYDNIEYIVRLKNTHNLNKSSPGWANSWSNDGVDVEITTWDDCLSIVKENGNYVLIVKLRDDAVAERWYGEW